MLICTSSSVASIYPRTQPMYHPVKEGLCRRAVIVGGVLVKEG